MTRWESAGREVSGDAYAARFERLAASGADVHGEAAFVATLTRPGTQILDAGCGTGRVAIELARRGRPVVGVDVSASMLGVARRQAPDLTWIEADLAGLDLEHRFDVVLMAGNVVPLLAAGTEAETVRRAAAHLRPGGLLVAGFGLDAAHLPLDEAPFGLVDYDTWCTRAGLRLRERYATWDGAPFVETTDAGPAGYAVSVHVHRPAD